MKINLQKIVLQIRVTKNLIKHYTKDILYRFILNVLFIYFNGELLWYHECLDFFPLINKHLYYETAVLCLLCYL